MTSERLHSSDTPPAGVSLDRRFGPRANGLEIEASLPALELVVVLRDLSIGGCAVECGVAFEPGALQMIRLGLPDEWAVTLIVQSVHCRVAATRGGAARYVTGFEFLHDQDAIALETLTDLIARIDPA